MTRPIYTSALALLTALAACDHDDDPIRIEAAVYQYVASTAEVAAADGYSSARLHLDEDADVPVLLEYTSTDDQRQYRAEYTITAEAKIGADVEYTAELLQLTRIATGASAGATEAAKWRTTGSVRGPSHENLTVALATAEPRLFYQNRRH